MYDITELENMKFELVLPEELDDLCTIYNIDKLYFCFNDSGHSGRKGNEIYLIL